MCEFTVFLEESGEKKGIAENIVKARRRDNRIVLTDASGSLTKVEGATIEVVDTLMQELVLKKA